MYTKNNLEYNAINMIRHLAAIVVIYSHSYILLYGDIHEPLHNILTYIDSAELAVYVFFAISGRLILKSYLNSNGLLDYIWKRFIRIFPALLICLILTLLTAFLFLNNVNGRDFFFNNTTLSYLSNVFFVGGYNLPFLFDENPYPYVANGSLWTLRYEVALYAIIPLCFLINNKNTGGGLILLGLMFIFFSYVSFTGKPNLYYNISKLGVVFIFSSIYEYYKLKNNKYFTLVFFLALVPAYSIGAEILYKTICSILIVLLLNHAYFYLNRLGQIYAVRKIKFDYSYGIYIYAFFVQQSLMVFFHFTSVFSFFLSALVISFAISWISWHVIEKPFLNYKNLFGRSM
ncbi:acyltransferase [Pectobacterium aroidearum]|uniref:acyltransferase family protein n=1 Tax=Pectobacterium aroidearum TaxID=1201031 RepID=UPI002114E849|nr:acyltransferase [Pectobacterium aroidearum]UUE35078.1 acyltransferase [Pectobacterium aroidearum]UUE39456.1 acyltransferase [Pectobacterium aroidearum]